MVNEKVNLAKNFLQLTEIKNNFCSNTKIVKKLRKIVFRQSVSSIQLRKVFFDKRKKVSNEIRRNLFHLKAQNPILR